MEKIRLLHLIASPVIGGAEKVLLTLAKHINRDKFDLRLGIFIDKRAPRNLFWEEAKKLNVPLEAVAFRNPYSFNQLIDLYRIVSTFRPHIIHSHSYKSNWLGFLMAKHSGARILSTRHGWFAVNNMKTKIIGKLDQLLFKRFDLIITVSNQIRSYLSKNGIPEEKMVTVRNVPHIATKSADKTLFRNEMGIPMNSKLVGYVGRLEPVKGCRQLLQAAHYLKERNQDIHFIIVGIGSEKKSLQELMKDLELEMNVHFCEFREDVESVYQALDLHVLPSLNEGVPLTVLEAMAFGVPVVATAVGGVTEIIQDRVTGLLVPPANPKALAEGILEAFANSEETQNRVKKALDVMQNEYSARDWIERIESIYRGIVRSTQ